MIEAFWSRMQVELLNTRRWRTRVELANAIFEYIEVFHNRRRRHSSLGVNLRATNPIESAFAAVKLRTRVTKGAGPRSRCTSSSTPPKNLAQVQRPRDSSTTYSTEPYSRRRPHHPHRTRQQRKGAPADEPQSVSPQNSTIALLYPRLVTSSAQRPSTTARASSLEPSG
jgi:Integrase core domain